MPGRRSRRSARARRGRGTAKDAQPSTGKAARFQPTLGEVTEHDPVLAELRGAASLLDRRPRCDETTAARHRAAVLTRYGLAIDDPALRLAVAVGGLEHQAPLNDRGAAVLVWWARAYRDFYAA